MSSELPQFLTTVSIQKLKLGEKNSGNSKNTKTGDEIHMVFGSFAGIFFCWMLMVIYAKSKDGEKNGRQKSGNRKTEQETGE